MRNPFRKKRDRGRTELITHGMVDTAQRLLEEVGIMVFVYDRKGRIQYMNRMAERVLGHSSGELYGRSIIDVLVMDDFVDVAEKGIEEVLAGKPFSGIYPVITSEEDVLEASFSVNPILNKRGEAEGALVFAQDITSRLEHERKLARESALAQGVLDEATVPIMMLDPGGEILYINPALEDICGYRLEEVRGKDWFDTMVPEPWRLALREFHASLVERKASGTSFVAGRPFENPIVTKAGDIIYISWKNNIFFNLKGEIEATISFAEVTD